MLELAHAPEVMTVEEAAVVLRIGRRQAYEAVRRGQIRTVRIGRSIRVPRASLVQFLTGQVDVAPLRVVSQGQES